MALDLYAARGTPPQLQSLHWRDMAQAPISKLDDDAIIQEVNAVHVTIRHFGGSGPSISTQVGTLRRLLLNPPNGEAGQYFRGIVDVSLLRNIMLMGNSLKPQNR